MTPKEKAEELVKKYINADFNCKGCKVPYCDEGCTQLGVHEAKQCALIAVDEILKCPATFDTEQVKYSDGTYAREYYEIPNRYWTKVKNEINLL